MNLTTLIGTAVLGALLLGTHEAQAHHRGGWHDYHRYHGFDQRWDRGRWHHRRAWRSGYRAGRWHRRHDRWDLGVGGLATGIVIGSQLNHNRYCPPDRRRDRRHRHQRNDWRGDGGREITACYRMEVLPDGRERRVELPISDCR